MIADLHAHLLPAELVARLRARAAPPCIRDGRVIFPGESLALHAGYTDPALRLERLDRLGVGVQLLSLPPLFGIDSLPAEEALPLTQAFNEGIAEICARWPGRFAWLAALPIADPDAALRSLGESLAAGALGAILPAGCLVARARADALLPLLARLDAARAIAFIHPGPCPGVALPPPPPDLPWARRQVAIQTQIAQAAITLLYTDLLDRFADLTVQLANLAGCLPMVEERIERVVAGRAIAARRRQPRLIADCASLGPRAIALAAAMLGPRAVVLGSDEPIFRLEDSLQAVAAAGLADADAVLGGTARDVLARAGFAGV
ncbi:MAG: hypothetical protein KatS3mg118_1791 [Paracoccaceae bacterium]|nr:MAG: hypothetical protein KatS3mg118_1791 [Paracoccaceae bacterium]